MVLCYGGCSCGVVGYLLLSFIEYEFGGLFFFLCPFRLVFRGFKSHVVFFKSLPCVLFVSSSSMNSFRSSPHLFVGLPVPLCVLYGCDHAQQPLGSSSRPSVFVVCSNSTGLAQFQFLLKLDPARNVRIFSSAPLVPLLM